MPENIIWARPEKTKAWSFDGRLYQSKTTAMVQWKNAVARRERYIELHGETDPETGEPWWFLKREVPPIYEIDWHWRALDDSEYQS